MAKFVKKFKDDGATILGGCCETRPSHIKAMSEIR
jgi:homocysteine S-methyltransferase